MTIEVESTQVAEIFEKDVNKLCEDINAVIEAHNILVDENAELKNIIKEVREILKYHLSNPSGTKNGWHIDIWNSEDISKLNEDLGILDKENKEC